MRAQKRKGTHDPMTLTDSPAPRRRSFTFELSASNCLFMSFSISLEAFSAALSSAEVPWLRQAPMLNEGTARLLHAAAFASITE